MNPKIIAAFVFAGLAALSTLSFGADSARKPEGMQGMGGMHGESGMSCMVGGECPCMGSGMKGGMGGGMMGGGAMPHLPPGNEKLQLQMWAEMMQKMGEIAAKYAAQVK